MTIVEARVVYANPRGRSRSELKECLRVLNEASQPVELSALQSAAILDAHRRLGLEEV